MKYICIKKETPESNPLSKVSASAIIVYMSLLAQSMNRQHNGVVAYWVHSPRNFFNPYLSQKAWSKLFLQYITELEDAGFIEFAGKSWFKVNLVDGVHLTNREREANGDDVWAYSTAEILATVR